VKFTVVLITHNNAEHVGRALESIRSQTTPDWECIVVDNGSTDDTLAVARAAFPDNPRFQYHAKANDGPSSGRNFAYRLASPKTAYVTFIDGDDWIREHFLEYLGNHLDAHPEAGMVVCQFDKAGSDGVPTGPGKRSRYTSNALGFPRRMTDDEIVTPFVAFFAVTGQGPFAMFRRSVYDQTTGYTESFNSHEDSDIFCQMALMAEVHSLPVSLYVKRSHASNLSEGRNRTRFAESCYEKFRAKWDVVQSPDPEKQKMLIAARRYYYTRHLPLRHFKVVALSIRDIPHGITWGKFKWMVGLFWSGIYETFFGYRARKNAKPPSA
jgi:glycosyltransferase involved in cell wall biosynthesis